MTDDLTLIAADRAISGWQEIRVTRGIERLPSDFEITMTERFPGELSEVVVNPGDACQVKIGGDLVITGYVDRYSPALSASQHSIRVMGRGKCQDLVDCAAEWPGGQISGATALGIAQRLAKPYKNLTVSGGSEVGGPIPQFNLMLGETAFEIIERVCRYRGLLAYDLPDGNLTLAQVGTTSMASGFKQGENVQAATVTYSMDQRFSEYFVYLQSMDVLSDLGDGGNLKAQVKDDGVPRHRRRAIICEAGGGGQDVTIRRATWEKNRRIGRSYQVQIVTDGWRDSAGTLWTPNTLVPLDLPALRLPKMKWVIGEVTYERGERGTQAYLTIMPADAFLPEPILLLPFPPDVPFFPADL